MTWPKQKFRGDDPSHVSVDTREGEPNPSLSTETDALISLQAQ